MLTIRLSRIGKKKKPMYRLIISEKARDPYGRALEIFGSYNPFSKELQVNSERINYWLSKGAGMSPTVNNLLIDKEIIKGKKVTASKGDKVKEEAKKAEAAKAAENKVKPEETTKEETPKPEEKPEETTKPEPEKTA